MIGRFSVDKILFLALEYTSMFLLSLFILLDVD